MKRRTFVKLAATGGTLAWVGVGCMGTRLGYTDNDRTESNMPPVYAYRAANLETLRCGFATPPREVGPWVYWFWWNNVVSHEEIALELDEMAAAGIAGVELRIATFHGWGGPPLQWMDPASLERLGHRQIRYLSDEWLDTIEFTCIKARQLGLRLAINLGMGWPPGGSWITDQHRSKLLSLTAHEVEAGANFEASVAAEDMAFAWKLEDQPKTVDSNSFQDLAPHLQRQRDRMVLRWKVPEGRWLIGLFSVKPGGLCDKGDGPEVDPGSREAILFHLNYMFSRLDPKLRRFYGSTLVDVASDSWEYERGERYWSPVIIEAFSRQVGYDLRGRMHALLGYGPDAAQLLRDMQLVEQHLIHSNFFVTVTGFLNERGLRYRSQAYGRGLARDLLYAYTLCDTPEVESGIVLPEACWAARTTGKPIVSAEAFTFFKGATPAALQLAANHDYYSEGVNRIQMHSFSYSPPGLPLPGWQMYANIHLNRNVPWWPFIQPLNTWMARQQWVLQAGSPVADVLVYPVKSNPENGPFFRLGASQPISAGNAVDSANELTLPSVLRACIAGQYSVNNLCLLDEVKTPDEARLVLQVLDMGGRLLACKSMPSEWPALQEAGAEPLRQRCAQAQSEGRIVDVCAKGWNSAIEQVRSVQWTPASANLVFQHRRVLGGDIYFVVNKGGEFVGQVSFPHAGQRPESWNPDTGQMLPFARYTEQTGRTNIPVAIAPSESACFVFTGDLAIVHVTNIEPESPDQGVFRFDSDGNLRARFTLAGEHRITLSDGTTCVITNTPGSRVSLSGPWQLSVNADQAVSPQTPLTLKLERLVSWREIPELKKYAGTATYSTGFQLPPDLVRGDVALFLNLGRVHELGRVTINGQPAGTVWAQPFCLNVTSLVKSGRNEMNIEVPNQLDNYLDDLPRPTGLLGPVELSAEQEFIIATVHK